MGCVVVLHLCVLKEIWVSGLRDQKHIMAVFCAYIHIQRIHTVFKSTNYTQ